MLLVPVKFAKEVMATGLFNITSYLHFVAHMNFMVVEWVYMTASYVTASCINREIKNLTGGDTEHRYKQNNQV